MTLPRLQQLSDPGRLIGAKTPVKLDQPGPVPVYAMSMWFAVSVSKLDRSEPRSLGIWSGCSGLNVTLTPEGPFENGGNYISPHYLPGKVAYDRVTLERVMTPHGATAVRTWLQDLAAEWTSGVASGGESYSAVTVTLYSAPRTVVHTWRLDNAIPIAWQLPTMSTSSSGFALEKLVLQHGGFLDVPEQEAIKFALVGPGDQHLDFEYNPKKVTLSRSREAATGKKSVKAGENVIDANALSVDLNELLLEGCAAVERGNALLRDWLEYIPPADETPLEAPPPAAPENKPVGASGMKPKSKADGSSPGTAKVLAIEWGKDRGGMPEHVVLRKFDLTITRFTADGRPSRATVALKLQECTPDGTGGAQPAVTATGHPKTPTATNAGPSERASLTRRGGAK